MLAGQEEDEMKTNRPNIDVEKLAREEFEGHNIYDTDSSTTEGPGVNTLRLIGLMILLCGGSVVAYFT